MIELALATKTPLGYFDDADDVTLVTVLDVLEKRRRR